MHILCEELHRGGEVGPEHQRGALHGQIFWPSPLFVLTLTLTKRYSINILKHGMTFSLPCTIAAPRRSYCRWSSWSCPQHNPLWLQTQTITMVSIRRNCNIFSSLKVAEVKSYWEMFGKESDLRIPIILHTKIPMFVVNEKHGFYKWCLETFKPYQILAF